MFNHQTTNKQTQTSCIGFYGLYRGFKVTALGVMPAQGIYLTVYEMSKSYSGIIFDNNKINDNRYVCANLLCIIYINLSIFTCYFLNFLLLLNTPVLVFIHVCICILI